jgi:methylmalonyl-CoA/ethylmalonyl-CoA epimerase
MPNGPTLHHLGHVVASIARELEQYRVTLGALQVSEIFEDPIQQARVVFLELPGAGGVQFELVEPTSADSPVARFLAKGGGLHHLCYEVDGLTAHLTAMKAWRAILIRSPKPAVAFGGRQIAWMRTAEGLLIEYLERG